MVGPAGPKRPVKPAELLVSLPAGAGPGGPPEELSRIHLQDGRQFLDDLQPNVGHCPLDPAEICPVHPGIICQPLLRDPPLMPEAAKVRRKKLAEVHVLNQPTCGLLAHGFKASKSRRK